ncbi:MAG: flagellar protein export ATPase FliI [Thiotrichales bacterium]|nr:flagellar protein export ATPase FliI [Thiotrichales bacterium]
MWNERLQQCLHAAENPVPLQVQGRLTRMVGLTLEASGCRAAIGDRCLVRNSDDDAIEAEVVGFGGDNLYLMPTGSAHGLSPDARVIPLGRSGNVSVGIEVLGRVLDGVGQPLDGKGPLKTRTTVSLKGKRINPLQRLPISKTLDVGVRSINTFLTVGRGQRLGLFAPSGVGKSLLLAMMARYTEADVIVVGLIGERGREVKEFIEQNLGGDGLSRSVVVATPADDPPLKRLHGAMLATSIAEYFRDTGHHVLLLMDSLTRFAQAQREIGLTIGEPPATKGYPPSVFARLPQLVERAGNGVNESGSITALYTVLTENDDQNDPIADSARAILDGHLVLSKKLADSGIYPAVDIELSISRAMNSIVDRNHLDMVTRLRRFYSLYEQNRDLSNVGAYEAGSDTDIDQAIRMYPEFIKLLRQDISEKVVFKQGQEQLQAMHGQLDQLPQERNEAGMS